MKKKGFLHRFKSYNTIKLVTLILLLVLPLVGILVYNKSLFEGMVINIYGSPNGSATISTSDDNNSKTNSNTNSNTNTQEIYTPPPPETVADPTPTPAPKSSLADNASSNVDSANARAKEARDRANEAISNRASGYSNAFTDPLRQTQTATTGTT
jgi:hypothetical protein